MAEEKKGEGEKKTVPQEEMDLLRSTLEKKVADANKKTTAAESRASSAEAQVVGDKFKVDLPKAGEDDDSEWTDEKRAKVDTALKSGEEAQKNLATLVPQYLTQQAKALAYEVAVNAKALDDVDDIQAKLAEAKTPNAMDALAKEIGMDYREAAIKDGTTDKGKGEKSDDSSDSKRQFDEGGGSGDVNKVTAIEKKIDDIDVNALTSAEDLVKAQAELDSAYEEATKSR